MDLISLDIETYPNLDMVEKLPEVTPDTRLKDEAKIKADIEKKKAEQIEKMALSPLYGKIACIGYYGDNIQEVHIDTEENMLKKLAELMQEGNIFVTWNGTGFDWDFIIKRSIILGIEDFNLRHLEVIRGRKNIQYIDLMEKWCGYGKMAKLDDVAKVLLGGECKEEFDVKQIPELIKTVSGKELIKRYCLQDCKLVYELAKKMGY